MLLFPVLKTLIIIVRRTARLAISIARKIGATIFLVAEDLAELRARLIMTFAGALMATQTSGH